MMGSTSTMRAQTSLNWAPASPQKPQRKSAQTRQQTQLGQTRARRAQQVVPAICMAAQVVGGNGSRADPSYCWRFVKHY